MPAYTEKAIQEKLNLIKESVLNTIPDTEAIYLFGSYAYGTPHVDSDLDICVIVPDNAENPVELRTQIRHGLNKTLQMPMDLIIKKSSIFHKRKYSATLDKIIARDGVIVYG
jgi:predicted nucleotidyltransferase